MRNIQSKILHSLLISTFIFIHQAIQAQDNLRINEFMAINQTTITDEDGNYSDWIEIYNPTGSAINLLDWSLTDDINDIHKWSFPDTLIQPGQCLLVFASDKNRSVAGNELHTNFRISGSGEYLALVNPLGNVVTEFNPVFPAQTTDVSYGIYDNIYVGITNPTPGTLPDGASNTIVPAPTFDKKHGFYENNFNLQISCKLVEADIYYTTDGTIPSPSNGIHFTQPLTITTTSIIRAIAIASGQEPSRVSTQTYIFLDDILAQPDSIPGYPGNWGPYTAIEGNIDADYEMDPEMLSDAQFASTVKNALMDIPTISLVTDKDHFFSHEQDPEKGGIYIYTGAPLSETTYGPGRGWERPVSMEYFNADGSHSLQVDCAMELQGGHSRRHEKSPKHSFRLSFKDEYGPTRLEYPIFEEGSNTDHNKIILRAGFGNSWIHHGHGQRELGSYQRDIWGKDTQRDMGHPSSQSSYVHLYINGIYWGMYAPSERMDNDFGEAYLGGDAEDYDVIKDYTEVADGQIDAWNDMMNQAEAGLVSNEAYQKIQGNNPDGTKNPNYEPLVDVKNLADYMLINFYGSNTDWDHHNWAAMRNRKKPGKGFKFFSWDGEHLVKNVHGNVLSENNQDCPSGLFNQLMENNEFQRLFANRVQKHCYHGGALTPEAAAERWMKRRDVIEEAVNAEAARWGDYRRDKHQFQTVGPFDLYNKENYWIPQQNFMLNTYFPQRTDAFINQLRDKGFFPQLTAPTLEINNNPVTEKNIIKGDVLSMVANEGAIYYTTDGTDPADWQADENSQEFELIATSATKTVLVPKSDIGNTWKTDLTYDDSNWQEVSGLPGGVGYDKKSDLNNLISLNVGDDMHQDGTNPNTSCYIRIPFTVERDVLDALKSLALQINYDDGFVAFINGTQVASGNVSTPLSWDSNNSSAGNHEGDVTETYDLSEFIDELKEGGNLLAIQGVNNGISSSDFIILPSLIGTDQDATASIASTAEFYSSSWSLDRSTHIKARTYSDGQWSALVEHFFVIPNDFYDLKITEIHYHPHNGDTTDGDRFEFIEIKNTGESTLDLGGLHFTKGINYEFDANVSLGPGEFIVLASNQHHFYNRYLFWPYDEYGGQLDNDGEKIELTTEMGDTICSFTYNDNVFWPQSADGSGKSLVPTEFNPTNNQDSSVYWRASHEAGGSPGADDIDGVHYLDGGYTDVEEIIHEAPLSHSSDQLHQNYPNPFVSETFIHYELVENAHVRLAIYNMMGQKVATLVDEYEPRGGHLIKWSTNEHNSQLSGGVYFYRIEIDNGISTNVITKKMIKSGR